ncbi:MAG TPA: hypothetical protein VGF24_33165 [Vicinamibacterales bacterium]|jgi:hypothetical protein
MTNDDDFDANECDRLLGHQVSDAEHRAIIGTTPPTQWTRLQWAVCRKFEGEDGLTRRRAEVVKAQQQPIIRKYQPTAARHADNEALADTILDVIQVATADLTARVEALEARLDHRR